MTSSQSKAQPDTGADAMPQDDPYGVKITTFVSISIKADLVFEYYNMPQR